MKLVLSSKFWVYLLLIWCLNISKKSILAETINSDLLIAGPCSGYPCPGTTGCTYLIAGSDANNYNVNSGQKICLEAGAIFTGQIGLYGGTIQNCATAIQSFSYFIDGASPSSTFNNYGTYELTVGSPAIQDSLVVNNYGTFDVPNLSVNANSALNNYCTLVSDDNLVIANNGSFHNEGVINISNNLTASAGSIFNNTDSISATNINLNGNWTNSGYLDAGNNFSTGAGSLGTLPGGSITTTNFFNNGSIEGVGCGNITVSTTSNNNGTGSLIGNLGFVDLTPPGSSPYIDVNSGTIGPNVIWNNCVPNIEICNNGLDDNNDGRIDEVYPGGVQTNLQLWLDAETGTNTTQAGLEVTSWGDQSANRFTANADVLSTDHPIYLNNTINYHPSVNFDGTYTDLYSDGLHLGTNHIYSANGGMQIFSVIKHEPTGNSFGNVFDFGHGSNEVVGLNWTHIYSKNQTPTSHGGTDQFFFHHTGSYPCLVSLDIDFEDDQSILKNGSIIQTTAIPSLSQLTSNEIAEDSSFGNVAAGPVTIGRQASSFALSQSRIFNGGISEVLVYNDTLSNSDQEKVNSYLAVKYGITLSHNYVLSDGTLIKDVNDGYANNIAGIALDSCGSLIQKQSKSVNDSSIVSIALGNFSVTNKINPWSFISDKSALIWGNNGAAENTSWSGTNYDITNGGYLGIDRVWKFNETKDIGSISFRVDVDDPNFDLPSLPPYPGSDGTYYLFLDDDGNFTNGGTTVQSLAFVSESLWGTTISDPTTSYFSIGIKIPEICNNGIDDDGDGDIDCVDGDCPSSDNDNDLICDDADLDDDNDGIPDIAEGCQPDTILTWNEISPSFINVSNGSPPADQSVTFTNEAGNFDYTFEVDHPEDNYFNQFSIGSYHALGMNPTALDSLTDYLELTIHVDNLPAGITLEELFFTIDDLDNGSNVNTREFITVVGYNGASPVSPIVTAQQSGFLVIDPPAGDQSVTATTTSSANLPFLPGTSNGNGTAEQGAVDILFDTPIDRIVIRYGQNGALSGGGIGFRQIMGTYCIDSDGDGIPNSRDLDSDNDGIYDLDEAGHTAFDSNTDGIIDGVPMSFGANGLFDGLETSPDNGILNYTIADSEASPDGLYDAYELDADEDTCFDSLEATVVDGDSDGIAGTGTPIVDANGLVILNTYITPPNDDWQNPLEVSCGPSCDAQAPVMSKN